MNDPLSQLSQSKLHFCSFANTIPVLIKLSQNHRHSVTYTLLPSQFQCYLNYYTQSYSQLLGCSDDVNKAITESYTLSQCYLYYHTQSYSQLLESSDDVSGYQAPSGRGAQQCCSAQPLILHHCCQCQIF